MRHVICFGNPLHGDDGFASVVYRHLATQSLPGDVRIFEAGTRGLDAIELLLGCTQALLVDVLAPNGRAGGLYELGADDVTPELTTTMPGHGAGVGELLRLLPLCTEQPPQIRILATRADRVLPFQPGLSPPVAAAVAPALEQVQHWLQGAGDD